MCLYIPFYIIALLSFNYKVQFCAFKCDVQNLPLRRVGRGEISPPSCSQRLTGMVIRTNYIGTKGYKSNYHKIITTRYSRKLAESDKKH